MNKKEMIINAIDTHIKVLYQSAETYKSNGNTEAQLDCFNEIRKYKELKISLNAKGK